MSRSNKPLSKILNNKLKQKNLLENRHGNILFVSIHENRVYLFLHTVDGEQVKHMFDFENVSQGNVILQFLYIFGRYRKMYIAGCDNDVIQSRLLRLFFNDENTFNYLFHPSEEKFNFKQNTLVGFDECEHNLINMDNENQEKTYTIDNIIPFGKYKGLTLENVVVTDPNYIKFLCKNISIAPYILRNLNIMQ